MNVTAEHQKELSGIFEGKLIRIVDNELKASFSEVNHKQIAELAKLNDRYYTLIKRSGTGMTVIFTPKKKP